MRSDTLVALAAALGCLAQTALAQTDPRGIFLDRGDGDSTSIDTTAIRFSVLLERGGVRKVVPATYTFQSGDKMKFQFELNRDRYIYILMRSITAEPARLDQYAGTRGIELIHEDDRRAPSSEPYQLLYPTQGAGMNNRVPAHAVKAIPSAESSFFRMDRKPGMEKLFVVVSPTPIDFSEYFDLRTGKIHAAIPGSRGASPNDVLGQLSRGLMDYGGNSQVSSSRGIYVGEAAAYAAAAAPSKPMLVPVDLRHVAGQ